LEAQEGYRSIREASFLARAGFKVRGGDAGVPRLLARRGQRLDAEIRLRGGRRQRVLRLTTAYTHAMRSVADDLRDELQEEVLRLPFEERMALALQLGEDA
jgi:hypothetical protein